MPFRYYKKMNSASSTPGTTALAIQLPPRNANASPVLVSPLTPASEVGQKSRDFSRETRSIDPRSMDPRSRQWDDSDNVSMVSWKSSSKPRLSFEHPIDLGSGLGLNFMSSGSMPSPPLPTVSAPPPASASRPEPVQQPSKPTDIRITPNFGSVPNSALSPMSALPSPRMALNATRERSYSAGPAMQSVSNAPDPIRQSPMSSTSSPKRPLRTNLQSSQTSPNVLRKKPTNRSGSTARPSTNPSTSSQQVTTIGTPYETTSLHFPAPMLVATRPKTSGASATIGGVEVPTHRTSSTAVPKHRQPPSKQQEANKPAKVTSTQKRQTRLMNPVSLLTRRRSQAPDTFFEDNVRRQQSLAIPPMGLPADYDPRIRGKVVHDFSVPRPKRNISYKDATDRLQDEDDAFQRTAALQPSPIAPQIPLMSYQSQPEEEKERPLSDQSSGRDSQHTPVFIEHLSDVDDGRRSSSVRAEELANQDFLSRVSKQSHSSHLSRESAQLPPFARRSQQMDPMQASCSVDESDTSGRSSANRSSDPSSGKERDSTLSSISEVSQVTSSGPSPGVKTSVEAPVSPSSPAKQETRPPSDVSSSAKHSSVEERTRSPSVSTAISTTLNDLERRARSPSEALQRPASQLVMNLPVVKPASPPSSPPHARGTAPNSYGHAKRNSNGTGFGRHHTSNASRFSFQLGGSAEEEQALEEKHRKISGLPSGVREGATGIARGASPGSEEEEYFDENAMYDEDELEAHHEDHTGLAGGQHSGAGEDDATSVYDDDEHNNVKTMSEEDLPHFDLPTMRSHRALDSRPGSTQIQPRDHISPALSPYLQDGFSPCGAHLNPFNGTDSLQHSVQSDDGDVGGFAHGLRLAQQDDHADAQDTYSLTESLPRDVGGARPRSGFYMQPIAAGYSPNASPVEEKTQPELPHRDSCHSERNRQISGLSFGSVATAPPAGHKREDSTFSFTQSNKSGPGDSEYRFAQSPIPTAQDRREREFRRAPVDGRDSVLGQQQRGHQKNESVISFTNNERSRDSVQAQSLGQADTRQQSSFGFLDKDMSRNSIQQRQAQTQELLFGYTNTHEHASSDGDRPTTGRYSDLSLGSNKQDSLREINQAVSGAGLGLSGFADFHFADTPDLSLESSRPSSAHAMTIAGADCRTKSSGDILPNFQQPTASAAYRGTVGRGLKVRSADAMNQDKQYVEQHRESADYMDNEHRRDREDDMYFDDGRFDSDLNSVKDRSSVNESAFDDPGFLKQGAGANYHQRDLSALSVSSDGPYPTFAVPNLTVKLQRESKTLLEDIPLQGPVGPRLVPQRNPSEDAKRLGFSNKVPPLPLRSGSSDGFLEVQQNLMAYHSALAEAASKAAYEGRFLRAPSNATSASAYSNNEGSQYSQDDEDTRYPEDEMQGRTQNGTLAQKTSTRSAETTGSRVDDSLNYSPPKMSFDFGFDSINNDGAGDFDQDDELVAAANAEALGNDTEGFYGNEFGFYAKPRPNSSEIEVVDGGYFGEPGLADVERQKSLKEPNLTPITERSEFSTRNSLINLVSGAAFGMPSAGYGPSSIMNPGLARLPVSAPVQPDDNMSFDQLRRLRGNAFGGSNISTGSNGSLHSEPNSALMTHGKGPGSFAWAHTAPSPSTRSAAGAQGYYGPMGGSPMVYGYSGDSNTSSGPQMYADPAGHYSDSPQSAASGRSSRSLLSASSDLEATPRKTPKVDSPVTARKASAPATPEGQSHSGHSRQGSDSVTYVREPNPAGKGKRWVLERRRPNEFGQPELVERQVVKGGCI